MVGDDCALSFVWCHLCHFKNGMLGQGSVICQCLTFLSLILVCQHGVRSALNIWGLIVMLFNEECM